MRKINDNVNHVDVGTGRAEEDVLELVHALMHEYRSLQYRFLRDGPHDITHMDGKVLGFFGRHPGSTQSDLALHSGRDKAQLARLIKALREKGLIDGAADAQDRRQIHLQLTSQGEAVQRALTQQAKRLRGRAVAGFSSDEQRQLRSFLARMKTNLAE